MGIQQLLGQFMTTDNTLIVILGPTASGKTRLGVELAKLCQGEIISADSRQVFCGMDIGTGKDLEEYDNVPYHLINVCQPGEEFSLFRFVRHYKAAFEQIASRAHQPLLVGGTGLYLDAVIQNYRLVEAPENPDLRATLTHWSVDALNARLLELKPDTHNTTDLLDRDRTLRAIEIAVAEQHGNALTVDLPPCRTLIMGIRWPREQLKQRITARLKQRLADGMVEEIQQLHEQGVGWEAFDYYGLEYRFVASYLQGQLSYNDMYQKLNAAIHYFSKQQEKWFRKMERKGVKIHWLEGNGDLTRQAVDTLSAQGIDLGRWEN